MLRVSGEKNRNLMRNWSFLKKIITDNFGALLNYFGGRVVMNTKVQLWLTHPRNKAQNNNKALILK